MRLPDCSKFVINRKMTKTLQFDNMTSSSIFFDVVLFLLSSLVTGSSFNLFFFYCFSNFEDIHITILIIIIIIIIIMLFDKNRNKQIHYTQYNNI